MGGHPPNMTSGVFNRRIRFYGAIENAVMGQLYIYDADAFVAQPRP